MFCHRCEGTRVPSSQGDIPSAVLRSCHRTSPSRTARSLLAVWAPQGSSVPVQLSPHQPVPHRTLAVGCAGSAGIQCPCAALNCTDTVWVFTAWNSWKTRKRDADCVSRRAHAMWTSKPPCNTDKDWIQQEQKWKNTRMQTDRTSSLLLPSRHWFSMFLLEAAAGDWSKLLCGFPSSQW